MAASLKVWHHIIKSNSIE